MVFTRRNKQTNRERVVDRDQEEVGEEAEHKEEKEEEEEEEGEEEGTDGKEQPGPYSRDPFKRKQNTNTMHANKSNNVTAATSSAAAAAAMTSSSLSSSSSSEDVPVLEVPTVLEGHRVTRLEGIGYHSVGSSVTGVGVLQGRGQLESSGDLSRIESKKMKFQKHVKETMYKNIKYLPRDIPGFAQLVQEALSDCFGISCRIFLADCHENAVTLLLGELKKRVNYTTKNFNDIKRRCKAWRLKIDLLAWLIVCFVCLSRHILKNISIISLLISP